MARKIFLGLGSNLGSKELNLQQALLSLSQFAIQIIRASSIYSTEPVDFKNQEWFLNQVVCAQTKLDPTSLLACCLRMEQDLGRERIFPKGPRTIDVDILLYSNWVVEESALTIPHPRLHLRRFVLVPMAEIAAQVIHPILKQPIADLLEQCPDPSRVVMYKEICYPS